MPDISLPLDWDKDTLTTAANMNANDNALIAGLSDGTKDIACNNVVAPLVGNASTSTKLATTANIIIDGDFAATEPYDGSADITFDVTSDVGIAATCTISRKINSAKMKVLQDHSTDVDLSGNNTLDTWRNLIYTCLGNPWRSLSIAFEDFPPNSIFGLTDAWNQISTTPLSSSELEIMGALNTGIESQYKVSSIDNLSLYQDRWPTSLESRELVSTTKPIIINFDPSIGINPHDFTLVSNIEFPSLGGDRSCFYDTALISDDQDNYISPSWQVSLQRNDELNPTHLQAVIHQTQNYINYLYQDLFSRKGGLPTHAAGTDQNNTDPWDIYFNNILVTLLAIGTTEALAMATALSGASPFEYNTLLFEEQQASGTGTYTDDFILRNLGGFFQITGGELSPANPAYSGSIDQYLSRLGYMHAYCTAHALLGSSDLYYFNVRISNLQSAYDATISGSMTGGLTSDMYVFYNQLGAMRNFLSGFYGEAPFLYAAILPIYNDSDDGGNGQKNQGKWAFPSNINISLFKR